MFDQDDDIEISFKIETQEDPGAPVFPSEEPETDPMLESENSVSVLNADSETETNSVTEMVQVIAADGDSNQDSLSECDEHLSDDEAFDVAGAEEQIRDSTLGLIEELSLVGKIEAILFASPKPLRAVEIHELLIDQGYSLKELQDALDELLEFYRDRGGGFHLKNIKRMGYQFQTTSAAKSLMEKQFSSRPRPLSRAALETLAVIAYRQKLSKGVTRAEVEFIRGVDAGSIFKTLMERGLLMCTGRKEIPGRPMMFGVTEEFLKVFQLGSINDLPPLESFQTPADIMAHANEKIEEFEREQSGVNPEEFVGDDAYTEDLGDADYNPLEASVAAQIPGTPESLQLDANSQSEAAQSPVGGAEIALPMQVIEQVLEHLHGHEEFLQEPLAGDEPNPLAREIQGAQLAPIDEEDLWSETNGAVIDENVSETQVEIRHGGVLANLDVTDDSNELVAPNFSSEPNQNLEETAGEELQVEPEVSSQASIEKTD